MNVSATRPAVRISSSTADDWVKGVWGRVGKASTDAAAQLITIAHALLRQLKLQSKGLPPPSEWCGRTEKRCRTGSGALAGMGRAGQFGETQCLSGWVYEGGSTYVVDAAEDA